MNEQWAALSSRRQRQKWVMAIWMLVMMGLLGACGERASHAPESINTVPATTLGALTFRQASIRAPIPGSDKSVGYLQIYNSAEQTINLIAASSPQIRTIEFHQTVERDGLMRMRRLEKIELASGTTTHFVPGGRHLMLFGVGEVDDAIEIEFIDAQGQLYPVQFVVEDILENLGE
ncbi:MAG: copper chaperone PCu(A)C [Pseudomonadota bacterium]